MLMIRLKRVGKKNEPSFRVVLTDKRRGPKKKCLEELGFYNPRKKIIQLNSERISHWLSCGAQPSATCRNLLVKEGMISGPKAKKGRIKGGTEAKPEKRSGGGTAGESAPGA